MLVLRDKDEEKRLLDFKFGMLKVLNVQLLWDNFTSHCLRVCVFAKGSRGWTWTGQVVRERHLDFRSALFFPLRLGLERPQLKT